MVPPPLISVPRGAGGAGSGASPRTREMHGRYGLSSAGIASSAASLVLAGSDPSTTLCSKYLTQIRETHRAQFGRLCPEASFRPTHCRTGWLMCAGHPPPSSAPRPEVGGSSRGCHGRSVRRCAGRGPLFNDTHSVNLLRPAIRCRETPI